MSEKQREYVGINVQYPISELILSGKKTIETRKYPIPSDYVGKDMILIETPGRSGKFKARMRAIIVFSECFKYKSKRAFYDDVDRHTVTRDSEWAWNNKEEKWGWTVRVKKVFKEPLPLQKRSGIKYSKGIFL